ncbi:MAG: 1-phosphofructokinase family hexose kinase [Lachnospiraceae bacterium]|nr:1-phosphofructokinase family hexose kinase [Candidatus Merdinaster equi]
MIITITMNPAIDKTVSVPALKVGKLNRVTGVREDAGGKGINVSKTIQSLGGKSLAVGFLGGMAGWQIANTLDKMHIEHDFVRIREATRTNLKVTGDDGFVTEINEPGPEITEDELAGLFDKLTNAIRIGDYVIISGSLPKGINTDIYDKLITLVHDKGAFAFVDADGEGLIKALSCVPDIVKPNYEELEKYIENSGFHLDEKRTEKQELLSRVEAKLKKAGIGEKAGDGLSDSEISLITSAYLMGNLVREQGVREVIVSLGELGALFLIQDTHYYCPALEVDAISTVGAGDALVAAYSYSSERGEDMEQKLKISIAASAGAVTTGGTSPAGMNTIREFIQRVKILRLNTP